MKLLTKVCRRCGVEKPLADYHKNNECKDGHRQTCRRCCNDTVNAWIDKKREEYNKKNSQRARDRKQLMVDHFGNKCHDCGNEYPNCVYEFHHLDPAQKDVNPSTAKLWSLERMWKELQKCIMVCSNCHKIRHFGATH